MSFFGVHSFSGKQFSMWFNYASKVFTNLEHPPGVIYPVKLKGWGFFPCYSFRPKSIVREQTLIFFFFNYKIIFEEISDFIHSTDLYCFPVNGPCDIIYGLLSVEIKGAGSDTINIFQNYFSKYNCANSFHDLTARAGGTRVVMQSCLHAILVRHSKYKHELFKCLRFSRLETNLIRYWLTLTFGLPVPFKELQQI